MRRILAGLLGIAIVGPVLACAPAQDGGADMIRSFFADLQAHRFDAAADLIREADGASLSSLTRERFVRGWRKAYEGYDIRFTNVVVQRYPESPAQPVLSEDIHRAGGVEGHVYAVKFEGTSNSPCVPVNSDVIPGTTQPIAIKGGDGTWFLLADAMVGFVDTCPGATAR